jgi:hypothetical protein
MNLGKPWKPHLEPQPLGGQSEQYHEQM